jgi:hypothetical protein
MILRMQAYLIFSLLYWPPEEQGAYGASQTYAERNKVVLRRMDNWAAEINSRPSAESWTHNPNLLFLPYFLLSKTKWTALRASLSLAGYGNYRPRLRLRRSFLQ